MPTTQHIAPAHSRPPGPETNTILHRAACSTRYMWLFPHTPPKHTPDHRRQPIFTPSLFLTCPLAFLARLLPLGRPPPVLLLRRRRCFLIFITLRPLSAAVLLAAALRPRLALLVHRGPLAKVLQLLKHLKDEKEVTASVSCLACKAYSRRARPLSMAKTRHGSIRRCVRQG